MGGKGKLRPDRSVSARPERSSVSYPARYPDARYPAPPRRGPAPPRRTSAPPQQGLWPGHPSAPFPAAPTGTMPRSAHPSGPLPSATAGQPASRLIGPTRRRDRLVLPGVVLSLIGLGVVAVLGLWWRSTPMIGSTGDLLTSAGDALGLLSGYGFVVLVSLMVRLPPL